MVVRHFLSGGPKDKKYKKLEVRRRRRVTKL
jgi:hypothetical protein